MTFSKKILLSTILSGDNSNNNNGSRNIQIKTKIALVLIYIYIYIYGEENIVLVLVPRVDSDK